MNRSNFINAIIALSLIGPGLGGNFFMFVEHVCAFIRGPEKKNINLIMMHLAFTNAMSLCVKGISDVIPVFHLSNFLDSVGCKTVIYLGRVARGLSICTTCLLSVVQAITISPRTTPWTKLKLRTAGQLLFCLLIFWTFNTLTSCNLLYYIASVKNMNRSEVSQHIGYCYLLPSTQIVRWLFLILMAVRDIVFQSLMGWSSAYMVDCLYTHHKRVLYLQNSRLIQKSKTRPEIRATQSILILTACFLFFYWTDFIFSFYLGFFSTFDPIILNIKIFLTLGYASLSPFVLISRNFHVDNCWPAH
ncbi:putative vomeronasal receptor-like protein 4 [Echinops telfairi]|uniref:Vomeronasal type-1 receptor n=1 Tax=Echinops telfairi TaxID=9371 RepID=A0ABM0J170_ECHTE|nr:putative vomeronasal receptor-like protein 4 [Echinops telfairi]